MSPLMRQHAVAKGFEFDDAQDAAPGMRQACAWIDKLVTVDVEAGARLATQHPLAQPLGEKAAGRGDLLSSGLAEIRTSPAIGGTTVFGSRREVRHWAG